MDDRDFIVSRSRLPEDRSRAESLSAAPPVPVAAVPLAAEVAGRSEVPPRSEEAPTTEADGSSLTEDVVTVRLDGRLREVPDEALWPHEDPPCAATICVEEVEPGMACLEALDEEDWASIRPEGVPMGGGNAGAIMMPGGT